MTHLSSILLCGAVVVSLSAGAVRAQTFGVAPVKEPTVAAGKASVELAPKVTLDVTTLRRLTDKGVLELEFTVINRSDIAVKLYDFGLANNVSVEGVSLVDFGGKRRESMGTSEGTCLCSNFANQGLVKAGEARSFWAWFALPPAEVRQMSVLIQDRSPILDVQLQ